MEEIVKEILIQNEGYLSRSAAVTAKDLVRIQDEEIHNALIHWVHTGEKQDVIRGEFSCVQLMDLHKMKYPAALIFLDWYSEDPSAAKHSLCYCEE